MPYEFKFPDIGEGLTEGEIVRWLVKEGDQVKEGQPLVEVETDKAVAEIPSPKTGTILKLLAKEKEIVKVGQTIVVFGEKGESVARAAPPQTVKAPPPSKPKSVGVVGELEEAPEEEVLSAAGKVPEAPSPVTVGKHAMATPAVRGVAKELGVDIEKVTGTGMEGRVLERDVRQAAEAGQKPSAPAAAKPAKVKKYDMYGYIEHIPLKGVRRSIAKAMVKSKYTAPHVTAMDEADVTELWKIREKEKKAAEARGFKLTLLPFVIKAVIAGLKEHPYLNATLDDENEEIILKKYFNIGIATDTPDGLMVPVIKNVGEKSILQLAQEMIELSEKARARKVDLADLKGGTFTITNYGAVRGIYGTPIINHPEVAILGMGRVEQKPVVKNEKIEIRRMLPLSLSFDHRVVDGAEAARFLNMVIMRIEDPDLILLET
jgi:pyruvate dehydrogenase E2 component (dihydrolipoamide acetyltransferase)